MRQMITVVPVENGKPDARKKLFRAEIKNAVLDENGHVIGFEIMYSSFRQNGLSWFRVGDPFSAKWKGVDG